MVGAFYTRAGGAGGTDPVPIHLLTTRQRSIVETIEAYEHVAGESCPISVLARRLRMHHSTLQDHLRALHRKGWLRTPNSPLYLRRAGDR